VHGKSEAENFMKILRRQKSAYVLSLILCSLGIAALLVTLWKTWPQISSVRDPFSTFMASLWEEELDFVPGIEFRLVYLFILGDAMLVSGVVVYVLSVQWLYLPGKAVWYRCPFCKKDWRSRGDKALVHCPHCRQLVHPIMIEKRV
jgi:DNA-directed RNA polymerase subunit RPC12/RpoP